jgi:hypothetical protein
MRFGETLLVAPIASFDVAGIDYHINFCKNGSVQLG